jgi:hypothetical protein
MSSYRPSRNGFKENLQYSLGYSRDRYSQGSSGTRQRSTPYSRNDRPERVRINTPVRPLRPFPPAAKPRAKSLKVLSTLVLPTVSVDPSFYGSSTTVRSTNTAAPLPVSIKLNNDKHIRLSPTYTHYDSKTDIALLWQHRKLYEHHRFMYQLMNSLEIPLDSLMPTTSASTLSNLDKDQLLFKRLHQLWPLKDTATTATVSDRTDVTSSLFDPEYTLQLAVERDGVVRMPIMGKPYRDVRKWYQQVIKSDCTDLLLEDPKWINNKGKRN